MSDTLRNDILQSAAGQRMIETVTPIYDNSYVGLWTFEAIGREFDSIWTILQGLRTELFPETATWSIELWEKRYGITPPVDATLEQRRQAILEMRLLPHPLSPYRLETYLEAVTGRRVEVTDYIAPYTFGISIIGDDDSPDINLRTLKKLIDSHKPSHLSYELWQQATVTITVKVETGYWRFNYLFCGTLPQYNYEHGMSDPQIEVEPEINTDSMAYDFRYLPCGVCTLGGGTL